VTLIIGIRCAEGVVLAADSAATMGSSAGQTAQQRTARKLYICSGGRVVVGVSGYMGLGQRLQAAIDDGYAAEKFKGRPEVAVGRMRDVLIPIVKPEFEMSHLVVTASRNPAALNYANFSMLVAIPLDKQPQLIAFTETCSPEIASPGLPFACVGSGQALADPFLAFIRRVLWPRDDFPPLLDGILGAYWTMQHAIETNPGGVGGNVQVVTLKRDGGAFKAEELDQAALEGHSESLRDLEEKIKEWRAQFTDRPVGPAPPAPPA
jgi:hypothetical protein